MTIALDRVMAAFVQTHKVMSPEQTALVREAIAAFITELSAQPAVVKIPD